MAVFNFTVRATDSEGSYADRQFNITVRNSRVERFMIVDNNDAWTSPDGTTWTQRVGQGGVTCEYGNGFWLIKAGAAYNAGFRKSTDGINYNFIPYSSLICLEADGSTATSNPLSSVGTSQARLKFWNGMFWLVALSPSYYHIWASVDGITWVRKFSQTWTTTSASLTTATVPSIEPTVDGDTMFFPSFYGNITISGANAPAGWSTTDGTTFNVIRDIAITTAAAGGAQQLMRVNGLYIGRGMSSTTTVTADYKYSTDGVNWTTVANPGSIFGSGITAASSLIYANGKLYWFNRKSASNAYSGEQYWTSVDGINWTLKYMKLFNSTTSERYTKVIFKNGLFIAIGSVGQAAGTDESSDLTAINNGFRVSLDGETWTWVNARAIVTLYNDVAAM
jgi:hypothetical protein